VSAVGERDTLSDLTPWARHTASPCRGHRKLLRRHRLAQKRRRRRRRPELARLHRHDGDLHRDAPRTLVRRHWHVTAMLTCVRSNVTRR